MTYRSPPSEEELERLSKRGTGCAECESKGTHGGRSVCRRQVAGKYNREVFYNRGDNSSRPKWCPKGLNEARRGYATTKPLPEPEGKKKAEPVFPPAGPVSPMPLNPRTHMERKVPRAIPDPPAKKKPEPPKESKLKRKAKDAPWGVTDE